jgi:threonine dehydratase
LIPFAAIEKARATIKGAAIRTPLVRLPDTDIYLKLETLQPVNSFKLRGATNAIRQAPPEAIAKGVVTASAGNMAQGVAWAAREAGVPATIVVPEHAPETKVAAIQRLGGRVLKVPFAEWWSTIEESRYDGADGLFVHPVQDDLVMAGNGTIGLELLEDLPDLDAVVIPFGGGGLTAGIASAVKATKPGVRVYTVEPETAAPLARSLVAGAPQEVEYTPSFVDGSGGRLVLPGMWPIVSPLVDEARTASLDETAGAVRLLAERVRVLAEGAGALALAAALADRAGGGTVVCIVSGGNIDFSVLCRILGGETP